MKSNIILCGYHWSGCKALQELIYRGDNVFVYTHDSPYYVPSLKNECEEYGINYTTEPISKENIPFKPDAIISVYYRDIIRPWVLELADGVAMNLHPSLLPKYRGCSSLSWALINGESYAGFSYHYITPRIDDGDLLLKKSFPIYYWDTGISLYYRAMIEGMRPFRRVVDMLMKKTAGIPQIGKPTYYKRECPHGGVINDEWDDATVKRFIRAMIFPPLPMSTYRGHIISSFEEYKAIQGVDLCGLRSFGKN